MAHFIKYQEYFINVDNINYIDTENGGDVIFYFNNDSSLDFDRTKGIMRIVNELLRSTKKEQKVIE
jgi:hypothetical protein